MYMYIYIYMYTYIYILFIYKLCYLSYESLRTHENNKKCKKCEDKYLIKNKEKNKSCSSKKHSQIR